MPRKHQGGWHGLQKIGPRQCTKVATANGRSSKQRKEPSVGRRCHLSVWQYLTKPHMIHLARQRPHFQESSWGYTSEETNTHMHGIILCGSACNHKALGMTFVPIHRRQTE